MLTFHMDYFTQKNDQWRVEDVSLKSIAEDIHTPCYIYSQTALINAWNAFHTAFKEYPHQINYAVKANSNLAVLNVLSSLNSGFDIVSGGELFRVLKANGNPEKIIFSGVGKTTAELKAALEANIGCFNVESLAELLRLNTVAIQLKKMAPIALRINPNVDPKSHPYISTGLEENKFGIPIFEAIEHYKQAATLPGIKIKGLAFHIGSQVTSLAPFLEALDKIIALIEKLKAIGIIIPQLNVGGGLGVRYQDETPPTPEEYVTAILSKLNNSDLTIHIEPGRAIVANAGVLLTRVEYIKKQGSKDKYFAVVDAAMNDLIRPTLYGAWQDIIPVNPGALHQVPERLFDIVGPVCETGDFLGKDRMLSIQEGDLLMIASAGAYGFSMSSNYNSRPRAAEVMVHQNAYQVVRTRETLADLVKGERIP